MSTRFVGRNNETRLLRDRIDGPGPSLTLVAGRRGIGKTALLRKVAASIDGPVLWYAATAIPDPDQRALLAPRIPAGSSADDRGGGGTRPLAADAGWDEILAAIGRWGRGGGLLVLDEAPWIVAARARFPAEFTAFWRQVLADGIPLRVVLTGSDLQAMDALAAADGPLGALEPARIGIGPLGYRAAGSMFPSYDATARMAAYGVFGGRPDVLSNCDPDVTFQTNLRQALFAEDAPLAHAGWHDLQVELQSVARYASLLRAMANGRAEWGELVAGAPDFTSGGQMAPYIQRLEAMGMVEVTRSLDAGPRSRSRRYEITDPFTAFWHRFVLPSLSDIERGAGNETLARTVRPALDAYMATIFPRICREWLRAHAKPVLGASAREAGGLWGTDYDLDASATLRNGAVCYGRCHWTESPVDAAAVDEIARQVRRLRYGFGKESRYRLVFSASGFTEGLRRRAARDESVRLVGTEELWGSTAHGSRQN